MSAYNKDFMPSCTSVIFFWARQQAICPLKKRISIVENKLFCQIPKNILRKQITQIQHSKDVVMYSYDWKGGKGGMKKELVNI